MAGRWWRAYDEAVDDPKLILLSDRQHRTWFNLCCVNSQNGGTLPPLAIISVKLRVSADKARHMVAELAALGLVDEIEGGKFTMHNWSGRQFQSDTSTPRVKRFRDRQRNVSPPVSVTPPETDTEAETDTEKKVESAQSAPPAPKREDVSRGTLLPNDWEPSNSDFKFATDHGLRLIEIEIEATKFRNYWTSKAGKEARKRDWSRTWQNWILNVKPKGNGNGNGAPNGARKPNGADFFAGLAQVAADISGNGAVAGSAPEEVPLGRVNIDG